MWKAEEDFPRGGAPSTITKKKQDENVPEVEKGIRGTVKSEFATPNKLSTRKRKHNETTSPLKSPFSKKPRFDQHIVETPLHQDLNVDLCVLGCVKQAFEYFISVSLPGNVVASLSIMDISASYTKQLHSLAHIEDPDTMEDMKSVDELFSPGMLISVCIKEITDNKQHGKKMIKLSSVPSSVNANISLSEIKDGMLLFGSISSVEDHGYSVDLGIKGLQAFLATKDAGKVIESHNHGSPLLSVGQPVWCVLKMKPIDGLSVDKSRVINVTIDPDIVKNAKPQETSNLNSLVPGTNAIAVVQNISNSGLVVNVFGLNGVIHSSQLPQATTKYKVGEKIQVKVLYIGASKTIQLTALPKLVNFNGAPLQLFGDLSIGKIVEATVARVENKRGVYFKLPENVKGFSAKNQLSDKENPNLTKYEKGKVCQSRIMGFNYMENVALITLKKSILDQKFLSVKDISVGDIVEGVVKEVTLNGVVVKLSKSIFAFVPCLHLADVPIKHPEKKFEAGMKMKCRVLKVDYKKSRLMLTHKKSFLKTKFPIISDYSHLRPKMELEGYIIAVKENVVIVAFFNDVKGFVTLKDMSMEKVEDPSTLFYTGQVIRCRVVYYNIEEKKLKLSFNFGVRKTGKEDAIKPADDSGFKIGKVIEARIMRAEKDRFRVLLLPHKEVAFLPYCHLSDFHEIQELRRLAFKPGQQLEKVTYFNQKRETIVTLKESFIDAAETNNFIESFDDLKNGTLLPAVIKNHQDYGMFLELAAGHLGLCPAKILTYLQPSSLQELFKPGQTVVTRLNKIDCEKKRFLGSVRLDECYEGGFEASLSLLTNYLQAKEKTLQLLFAEHNELSVYEELNVGDVVMVTVSSVLKKGILGDLPTGAKALATRKHLAGVDVKVGSQHKALVLFVDPLTPCVELTLDQKLIKVFSTRKENDKTQLKKGQILKADVQMIKPEFMLMSLRAHGSGRFVYVPFKKHINDVETDKPYEVGTYTELVLKDVCGKNCLAVLKSLDPEILEKDKAKKVDLKNLPAHPFQPGMFVDAKIKAVHALQMNITADHMHGRIHITEVTDSFQEGENPLHKYCQGQTIRARVIGLRDIKSQSYLPITHPKSSRTLLECSLKESKMNCNSEEGLLVPKLSVKIGDKVTVYVIKVSVNKVWVQVSLTQQGYIDMFHLSDNMNVLNDVNNQFQIGQVYEATILECINDDKLVLSRIGHKLKLAAGEKVTAQISSINPGVCLNIKLPEGRLGVVKAKPSVLHYVGQYVRCQVQEVEDTDRLVLSLLDQSKGAALKVRKRKRDTSVSEITESKAAEKEIIKKKKELKKEKKKKSKEDADQWASRADFVKDSSDSDESKPPTQTDAKSSEKDAEAPRLSLHAFSWSGDVSEKQDKDKDSDDDDGDENVRVESLKAKKKRKRDEEKVIQEYEKSQLEGNITAQTAADFERLVLHSPNSSIIWLRFMAFHIELGEIEKARAVAEKALNTISFREEHEKKNVWLAYLNLETMYGDHNDVQKLLDRAVSYNDPVDIYLKMCDIYVAAGKVEKAERLYATIIYKHKKEVSIWKAYGQFMFKQGRPEAARGLLKRMLSAVDKKLHVEVITKFATMEFSDGDKERGRTMFENIIASYPGRTDLWSVYVDMVVKVGDIEGARQILERAVKQKLNSRKLSFLIHKYIRFEESHGTEEKLQYVKHLLAQSNTTEAN